MTEKEEMPNNLYAFWDKDGEVLVMHDIKYTSGDVNPTKKVGVYVLREIGTVKNDVKFVPDDNELTF